MSSYEEILPLFIVNYDIENYTALFRSIQYENYKSFEFMISLLSHVKNRFISKCMIKSLPVILTNESHTVLNYFDTNFYIPKAYEEPLMLPWPKHVPDDDKIIFTSNTTLLSRDHLLIKF